MSYSGELGEIVLVLSPHIAPHVPSDLMKLTQIHKGDSTLIHNFLSTAVFFVPPFFYKTAAA